MYVCPIFIHIMYGDQLTMKEWERVKEIEVLVVNKSVCTLLPQGSYYTTHSGVCVCVGGMALGEVSCLHRKLNDHRQPIVRSPSKMLSYLSTPLFSNSFFLDCNNKFFLYCNTYPSQKISIHWAKVLMLIFVGGVGYMYTDFHVIIQD